MKLFLKGNKSVIKGFKSFEQRVQKTVKTGLDEWQEGTVQLAKNRVPKRTGELQGGINGGSEGEWVRYAGTPTFYAPFVEFGTGSLVDVPEGLEDYAMQFKGAGIKEVNLPARPYLFNSAREKFTELMEKLRNVFA